MIKLKTLLNENEDRAKDVLRKGLLNLLNTSHLVQKQVLNNLDTFIDNLNMAKFFTHFGRPIKFLGSGVFGSVFDIGRGKVLKITLDYVEAPFLYELLSNPINGMVTVDKVARFDFGESEAYGIVRDDLTPITKTKYRGKASEVMDDIEWRDEYLDYEDPVKIEVKKALQSMFDMDPNWRMTHIENLGFQNGNVVLYDGFSKNVVYPTSSIPKVDLT